MTKDEWMQKQYAENKRYNPGWGVRFHNPLPRELWVRFRADELSDENLETALDRFQDICFLWSLSTKSLESYNLSDRLHGLEMRKDVMTKLTELELFIQENRFVRFPEAYTSVDKIASESVVAILKSLFKKGTKPDREDFGFAYWSRATGDTTLTRVFPSLGGLLGAAQNESEEFVEFVKSEYSLIKKGE